MPARVFIVDEKTPRLPNGNVHVPKGAIARPNLSPLSPERSLSGPQRSWIKDEIERTLAPLKAEIATLRAAGGKAQAPASLDSALKTGPVAKKTTAPAKEKPPVKEEPATTPPPKEEPAAPKISAAAMALLATVTSASLRKKVADILRKDLPEANALAEARGLIKRTLSREEALGDANDADE